MPNGWTPAAASSTLEEWSRTFSRWQQSSCFRITVFYGVRAGEQKVGECDHWCTNRRRSTKTVPTVYQWCTNRKKQSKQSKDGQNSKNDHWCTVVTMSTKTVPTVYQQCTKNSQKIVKTAKISLIIGVPIVRGLPRQYQQCTNR